MLISIAKSGWKELAVQIQKQATQILISPIPFHSLKTDGPIFKSRLLALKEDGLLIESPLDQKTYEIFYKSKLVYVMLIHLNCRWEIGCVLQGIVPHSSPEAITIPAYHLSNPLEDSEIQRRAYFRVDLTSLHFKPVRITPIDSITQELLIHKSFLANPVNISGGGIGISAPSKVLYLMDSYQLFKCDLHMQTDRKQLDLSLQARRSCYSKKRDTWIYIGLCFEYENDHKRDHAIEELVHFATSVQRYQLSHRRKKWYGSVKKWLG